MRNRQPNLICIFLFLLLAWGCKRDLTPQTGSLLIPIEVSYDTSGGNFNLPLQAISVKLVNQWNGSQNQGITDAAGKASFSQISAGVYNVQATVTIPKELFNQLTGENREEDITLNASLNKITLNNTLDSSLKLKMQIGRLGGLVIKQIYYPGSSTTNGAGFRDQFVEIYNNSNEVIYADSLYIAELWGNNSTNPNLSTGYFVTSGPMTGQYDWNKSIGMPSGINAVEDYLYAKSLYRIPGNGTTYPVQPGQSIILAQTAVNHKAPYSNTSGGTINIKDPSLTVDLSKADFEVYLAPYLSSPLTSDVDNPMVPDLIMLDYSGKDWLLDNLGRGGYAIFKTDEDIPSVYPKYPISTVVAISSSTTLYYQLPVSKIIDAVETQPNTATSRVAKRLPGKLDVGFTYAPAGAYSSQSVIRKTAKIIAGRRILMDTNNSTNDFDYLNKALPYAFK